MIKKTTATIIAMMMLLGVTNLYATDEPIHEKEKEYLNYSKVIDTLTMDNTELWHGDKTTVRVSFSEKPDVKITENTILTLDIPTGLKAFKVYKEDPINLTYQGVNYGIVYSDPENTKIIVEFNENTNDRYDIKGSFYFQVSASFLGTLNVNEVKTNEYVSSFNTDGNDISYTISGRRTEGKSQFFYKPGGTIWPEDPSHINWWLHINRNQEEFINDIEILDTLKEGQKFVLKDDSQPLSISNLEDERFQIVRTHQGIVQSLTVEEFINLGYGEFSFLSDNSFRINILKDKADSTAEYMVRYSTSITASGKYQTIFYNDAVANYKDVDGIDVVVEQLDRSVENITRGGMIAPAKGVLRIIKFATHGLKEAGLSKVEFKLYNEDGTFVNNIGDRTLITDERGLVDTPPLDEGRYYIQEVNAPSFVNFNKEEKHFFEIKMAEETGVELVIFNPVKTKDLEVEKVWKDSEEAHPNITINLYDDTSLVDSVILTNENLTHTFTNLPEYTVSGDKITYRVEEEFVEGYDTDYLEEENKVTITNTKIKNAELESEKTSSVSEINAGDSFEYQIIVRNITEGSNPIKQIKVEDILPSGIKFKNEYIEVNGEKVLDAISEEYLSYTFDNLEYGKDLLISFEVVAENEAFGIKTNVAIVTDLEDPDNPQYPLVETVVFPKEVKKPIIPLEPSQKPPQEEEEVVIEVNTKNEKPLTPNTGINSTSSMYVGFLILMFALMGILIKKEKR